MPFPAEGLDLFYMSIYGGFGYDVAACSGLGLATGIVQTGNPSYGLNDFLSVYPKFFGPATVINGSLISGSPVLTLASQVPNIALGQLVTGTGTAPGSLVFSIDSTGLLITLTQDATLDITSQNANLYATPFIPLLVLQLYINLATASLPSARWKTSWFFAVSLFVAHYATLWMQTETGPNTTAAQVANSGLQQGIVVSQTAGAVNYSSQPIVGFEDWGSLNLTQYGIQLATLAQVIGAGPIYVSGSGWIPQYGTY